MDSVLRDVPAASAVRRRPPPGGLLGSWVSTASAGRLLRIGWVAVGLTLTLAAVVFAHAHRGPLPPLGLILAVASTAPLLVVRRWPSAALSLVIAADAIFVVCARLAWPPTAVAAWLIALAACPLLLRRSVALVLLAVAEAAVLTAVFVPFSVNPRPWDAPITEGLAVLLAWGGAEAVRSRRTSERQRALAQEELDALHQRAAMASGRAEIARELHDVVAHHVSLIAVRAATAPYQVRDVSDEASAAFREIAGEARAALDDLRAVLGVLRSDDGVPHAPQPSLADRAELLQRLRSNGMTVSCTERGISRPIGAAIELCCYRIIQEALTNAAKHAPGAPVEVTIDYRDTEIAVTIIDLGPAVGGIAATDHGGGFGLVGMRERVAAFGGALAATAQLNGFFVEARIPIPPIGRTS